MPHRVIPDPKSQFKVTFQKVDRVPRELIGILLDRSDTENEAIRFPYAKPSGEEKPVRDKAGAKKPPAKRSKF